jgi:GNAT superfamily N-acetyltransferase
LTADFDREGFDCGDPILNNWLVTTAGQHMRKRISVTYVQADGESAEIKGFYALTVGQIDKFRLPERFQKPLPNQIPVFVLARMAVSLKYQGKGFGQALLLNAMERVKFHSSKVGGVGMLVDAKPDSVDFYRKFDFHPSMKFPSQLFHLF